MTTKKNEFLINTNKSFNQIKNLASSVRIFNSKAILYPFFKLQYARQRKAEIKFKNHNSFLIQYFQFFLY